MKVPTGPGKAPLPLGDSTLPRSNHLGGRDATAKNYWSIKVLEPTLERKPELPKPKLHLEINNNIPFLQVFTVNSENCLNESRTNKQFEPNPDKPLLVLSPIKHPSAARAC